MQTKTLTGEARLKEASIFENKLDLKNDLMLDVTSKMLEMQIVKRCKEKAPRHQITRLSGRIGELRPQMNRHHKKQRASEKKGETNGKC